MNADRSFYRQLLSGALGGLDDYEERSMVRRLILKIDALDASEAKKALTRTNATRAIRYFLLGPAATVIVALLCSLAQGDICQDLPDGTGVCLEDPGLYPVEIPSDTSGLAPAPQPAQTGRITITLTASPGVTFTDDLSYSGSGSVLHELPGNEIYLSKEKQALDGLLFDLWGMFDAPQDVAFVLAHHGYETTQDGLVTLSDESQWQVVFGPGEIIRLEEVQA